ncbi:PREDICTED: uncharacterized protein LOC106894205 [Calidris pugnax]|uniref:uncharacterized protein LOC106894205 n=1 Tax=Calidris pugnax TaxID=198806 RepID=UPI00071D6795|nr:PREDICTED: uncharacterized protein LOC106894205 [Calidris pugnax]
MGSCQCDRALGVTAHPGPSPGVCRCLQTMRIPSAPQRRGGGPGRCGYSGCLTPLLPHRQGPRDAEQPRKVWGEQQPFGSSLTPCSLPPCPIHVHGLVLQLGSPWSQVLSLAGLGSACGSRASVLCKREVLPACLPCGAQISPMVTRALCQLLSPGDMSQGPGATACHLLPALSEASEDKVCRWGLPPSPPFQASTWLRACPPYPLYIPVGRSQLGCTPRAVGLDWASPVPRDGSRPGCSRAGVSAACQGAGTPGLPGGQWPQGVDLGYRSPRGWWSPVAALGPDMGVDPAGAGCRRQVSARQN